MYLGTGYQGFMGYQDLSSKNHSCLPGVNYENVRSLDEFDFRNTSIGFYSYPRHHLTKYLADYDNWPNASI